MKKMGLLFLIIGIISLAISLYFFSKKEKSATDLPPMNKQKGNEFEDYVIQLLGKQKDVIFIGKVSDYHKNGVSALENKEPDLKFKYKNNAFAIECKWRSSFTKGAINWAKDYQINNYKSYQNTKQEKVYIAIGIGGKPNLPAKLFIIPLFRLTKEFANEEYIQEFKILNENEVIEILKK